MSFRYYHHCVVDDLNAVRLRIRGTVREIEGLRRAERLNNNSFGFKRSVIFGFQYSVSLRSSFLQLHISDLEQTLVELYEREQTYIGFLKPTTLDEIGEVINLFE